MSHDTYAALPGVNFSTLKHIAESPAHYAEAVREPPQDRDTFRIGRLLHTLVMEPELYDSHYAVFEGVRRGGAWDDFQKRHQDQTIVKPDMVTDCFAMANAVRTSGLVAPYFYNARHELTVQWTDEATGIRCKARLDWLTEPALIDLKSTVCTEERAFGRAAARYLYPQQLAFYCRAARSLGWDGSVKIVAVEKSSPWDVAVFPLDDEALSWGDRTIDEWLATLARCRESGRWPGRYTDERPLSVPSYLLTHSTPDFEDYIP